jgi:acetyl-CoA acetyltransferase family protein
MTTKTASAKAMSPKPVIIDGIRTSFMRSNGAFASLMSHDLGRYALTELLTKAQIRPDQVDQIIMGTVISDPQTSNVAREILLGSPLPRTVPAYTVSMACISANAAFTSACDMITSGHIRSAIVGGTETFSDPPIRLAKHLRQVMVRAQKAKKISDYISIVRSLKPSDLLPDIPSPNEFSTGLSMGQGCERMARLFGVTRAQSDAYALRSHQLAARAWEQKHYQHDVAPIHIPPEFEPVAKDDGPRGNTSLEALAKLPPAFDKPFGISTAGSSSFFSDGAAALWVTSQAFCEEQGQKPLASVVDYIYAAGDPLDELLLGPALTIPLLLKRHDLTIDDIDVWELHEAFAAQILANLNCIASDSWSKSRLGLERAAGNIPLDKLNLWGGSLSLGHPFGATGARLLLTASRRLEHEKGRYAIVSGCAAGGLGSAILLERCS